MKMKCDEAAGMKVGMTDIKHIFILTKTPQSERARLCLQLAKQSKNAVLYLAGDGVYNLLAEVAGPCDAPALAAMPRDRIIACKEDLEARGVQAKDRATVPDDFYRQLVDEMMQEGSRIYTF
jgi:tRNA 2-thiouridine synthesizing protein B